MGALRSEQVGFDAREGRRASVRRQLVGVAGGEDLISRRTLESKKEMRCGPYGSPRALAVQTKPLGLDLMPAISPHKMISVIGRQRNLVMRL